MNKFKVGDRVVWSCEKPGAVEWSRGFERPRGVVFRAVGEYVSVRLDVPDPQLGQNACFLVSKFLHLESES